MNAIETAEQETSLTGQPLKIADDLRPHLAALRAYFEGRADVSMAFVFGSQVKGTVGEESDLDVAAYFALSGRRLEWEEPRERPQEQSVWDALERLTPFETDFVALNRAPVCLAKAVLEEGLPLVVKDRGLFWRLWLTVGPACEDFVAYLRDFRHIQARSHSLSPEDQSRLEKLVIYLNRQLAAYGKFSDLTWDRYAADDDMQRNVERWCENLANATIDIGKVLLASAGRPAPSTYQDTMRHLRFLPGFSEDDAELLSRFARLRNILAHDYLDVVFRDIERLIRNVDVFRRVSRYVSDVLDETSPTNPSEETTE